MENTRFWCAASRRRELDAPGAARGGPGNHSHIRSEIVAMREVLFQGDGFDDDLRDLPLAMKSALALAKRYASSGDVSAEAVREARHGIRAIEAKQRACETCSPRRVRPTTSDV
jgi:hypothetical protein